MIDYAGKLAEDKHSSLLRKFVNYGKKCFITLGHRANVLKLFSLSLMNWPNELKCLSLAAIPAKSDVYR